jgi:3-isopropylmalate dehydratase small subunit
MRGRVWKFDDSIDTDVIAPGGERGERLRETTMAAVRPEFPREVKPGDIIVAGRNFGCGSHREEANLILREIGIQAIVAESIARLFFRISVSIAQPIFIAPGITDVVEDQEILEIDYAAGTVKNINTGHAVEIRKFPSSVERIFRAGGMIPLLKQRLEREQGQAL